MRKNLMFKGIEDGIDLYLLFSIIKYEGIPIVFVCTNHEGTYYICLCSEIRGMQRWIIGEVEIEDIISLIGQEVDLYSVFKSINWPLYLVEKNKEDYTVQKRPFDQIDELDLPEKGAMLEYIDDNVYEWAHTLKKSLNDKEYIRMCKVIVESDNYEVLFNANVIEYPPYSSVITTSTDDQNEYKSLETFCLISTDYSMRMSTLPDFDIIENDIGYTLHEQTKTDINHAVEMCHEPFAA